MERTIFRDLKKWQNSPYRKPLILYGARQIGKTYALMEFGRRNYTNAIYCNFETDSGLAEIFDEGLNPERIMAEIGVLKHATVSKGTTLVFFDEIQACEKALTSLKYFNENANEYHIVAAGSFLGLALNRGHFSFPVGKVDMLNMFPLSFEEFLIAGGYENLRDMIKEKAKNFSAMNDAVHQKAMELYRTYLVVGGYPEAVKAFFETGDFNFVRSVQATISNAYIADMAKYATPNDTVKSMAIFNTLDAQLAKENTKFQYSIINAKARAKEYELALEWLKTARVVLPCTRISEGKYPVKIYEDFPTFKIYFADVGILSMRMSVNPDSVIHNIAISDKTKGTLAENFVAQELTLQGKPLHYWSSGNTAEIDFVLQDDKVSAAIPVEVKWAENTKAKSLLQYRKKYEPPYVIKVSGRNFGFEGGVKSVPLYALFCTADVMEK